MKKIKKALIIALEKNLGIVTPACNEVGVSRETFYRYYKEDLDFKNKVDEINEITLDFVENQLLRKIKDGSEKSIMFYMRYKARNRGYTDELNIKGDMKHTVEVIKLKGPDYNENENEG